VAFGLGTGKSLTFFYSVCVVASKVKRTTAFVLGSSGTVQLYVCNNVTSAVQCSALTNPNIYTLYNVYLL
jgi:hypothetical protein